MPIEYHPPNFTFWPDARPVPSLHMDSFRLGQCIDEVKRRELRGVFGRAPGFRETTLDFLSELPDLEAVDIADGNLRDLSGLYRLHRLRALRLPQQRPPLEFQRLPTLESLSWSPRLGDSGSGSLARLENLTLWPYKAGDFTFRQLDLPPALTTLRLAWSNVRTLEGMSLLPKLVRFEIDRCRNLESLGQLAEVCPNLEFLLIGSSGRLKAMEAKRVAARLPRLCHLVAENELLIKPTNFYPDDQANVS